MIKDIANLKTPHWVVGTLALVGLYFPGIAMIYFTKSEYFFELDILKLSVMSGMLASPSWLINVVFSIAMLDEKEKKTDFYKVAVLSFYMTAVSVYLSLFFTQFFYPQDNLLSISLVAVGATLFFGFISYFEDVRKRKSKDKDAVYSKGNSESKANIKFRKYRKV